MSIEEESNHDHEKNNPCADPLDPSLLRRTGAPVQTRLFCTILKVKETFTKQEKTSSRSSHREEVAYAVVQVQIGEELHEVTVRDNSWFPLKAGDSVIVTRNFLGKYVEKRSETAYSVIGFSVLMGVIVLITEQLVSIRQRKEREQEDSGS